MPNTVYLSFFSMRPTDSVFTSFFPTKALIPLYYGDLFACPSSLPAITFALKFLLGTNLKTIPHPGASKLTCSKNFMLKRHIIPHYLLPFCPVLLLQIKSHLSASIQFLFPRTLSSLTIGTWIALLIVVLPMPGTVPGICSSQLFENIRWTNECMVASWEPELYLT